MDGSFSSPHWVIDPTNNNGHIQVVYCSKHNNNNNALRTLSMCVREAPQIKWISCRKVIDFCHLKTFQTNKRGRRRRLRRHHLFIHSRHMWIPRLPRAFFSVFHRSDSCVEQKLLCSSCFVCFVWDCDYLRHIFCVCVFTGEIMFFTIRSFRSWASLQFSFFIRFE